MRRTVRGHYDECSAQYGDGPCDTGTCPARFGADDEAQLMRFVRTAQHIEKIGSGASEHRHMAASLRVHGLRELTQLGDLAAAWKLPLIAELVAAEKTRRLTDPGAHPPGAPEASPTRARS